MKKRVVSAVLAMILAITCVGITTISALAAPITDDFESYSAGEIPSGWTGDIAEGGVNALMGIQQEENGNKFLRLHVGEGGTAWMMSPKAESNRFEVSFRIRVHTAGPLRLSCVGESGDYGKGEFKTQFWDEHVAVKYSGDNNIFIATPKTTTVVGEWHKVKFIIDTAGDSGTWYEEVHFDGDYKPEASGKYFVNAAGALNRIKLMFDNPRTGGQQVTGTVDIDDFDIRETKIKTNNLYIGKYDGLSSAESHRTEVTDTVLDGEKCSLVKGNDANGTDKDFFFNYPLPAASRDNNYTMNISFIPSDTVSEIHFATAGHALLSPTVPMSRAVPGVWNTITLVTDTASGINHLYLNGEFYGSTKYPVTNNNLRVVVSAIESDVNGMEMYMDNYMICGGKLTIPPIDSENLTISAQYIYGCANMTAEKVIDSLNFSNDGYNAVITDNGTEVTADTKVTDNMKLSVWADDVFVAQYFLNTKKYELDNMVFSSNGYEDNKFNLGKVSAEFDMTNYSGTADIVTVLAQYDSDDNIIGESSEEWTVRGTKHIKNSLDIEKTDNTYIQFVAADSTSGDILYQSDKIYPYSSAKIENVSKTYENFTSKAAVFAYDDGVTDDIALIKLFDKYGVKGTFNLVGSRLENNYKNVAEEMNTDVYSAVKEVYKNHEIQNHTYTHKPSYLMEGETSKDSYGNILTGCSLAEAAEEVTKNKSFLEEKLGVSTRGIAWPNGYPQVRTDYDELERLVKENGHEYARYKESGKFTLPDNWMQWQPTCRHIDAPYYTKQFVSMPNGGDLKLYYVWGHAYEFTNAGADESKNLTMMENTLSDLYYDNVWFASCNELYDYIHAVNQIEITDTRVKNNSAQTVYVHVNGVNTSIKAGESYTVGDKGEEMAERPEIVPLPEIFIDDSNRENIAAYTERDYGDLIMASYDGDGRLIKAVLANGTRAEIPTKGAKTIKAFLFESLSSLKPLTDAVIIDTDKYNNPTIACWGDSLTYGQESSNPSTKSYPSVLARLSGSTVYNMGVPGETATTIAARQGTLKIELANDVTIPASGAVAIKFRASNGGVVTPRDVSLGGWNPCTINGVSGRLDVSIDSSVWPRVVKSATFTRTTSGESVTASAGDELIPQSHSVMGDINVIFSGTNGGWSTANLTEGASSSNDSEIKAMIELLTKQGQYSHCPDKYIIIGLTTNTDAFWEKYHNALANAFGDKFLNLRKELESEQLLRDNGITPTADDISYIQSGRVPPSLLAADGTHFNDKGYEIVGALVYEKMRSLEYIK